ncbi:YqaA family protein [Vogesella sp. LIG4]|uniref:YqaA family protein n=1 Tax=Vogesella sp. LIG4 TaxID=1192162 RepID=UPI00081FA7F6|nr:DedA family protein [Vogesella sp. LIG4]SCK13131.1 membrane protein YqaA, SNARE-associated domain [Vogesella sp. LIG4]
MDSVLLLAGLAASAFLSATVLPGNSELALGGVLLAAPRLWLPALLVATAANSVGSLTSVWLGRRVPPKPLPPRAAAWFARFGPAALLLSWLPVLGDALPLAAGWLRLPWAACVCWITLGKFARYAVLVAGMLWLGHGH